MFRDSLESRDLQFAGGNLTILTGILPTIFPNMIDQIETGLTTAITEADWEIDIETLTISSIQLLNSTSYIRKMTLKEMENALKQRRLKASQKKAFVIYPPKLDIDDETMEDELLDDNVFDENADINVEKYLSYSTESLMKCYIYLSDRYKYTGGTVLLEKHDNYFSEGSDDNSMYEEDDSGYESVSSKTSQNKYSALTSTISRYTPGKTVRVFPLCVRDLVIIFFDLIEKGEMLVTLSPFKQGFLPVQEGSMVVLIIEYSQYIEVDEQDKQPIGDIKSQEL